MGKYFLTVLQAILYNWYMGGEVFFRWKIIPAHGVKCSMFYFFFFVTYIQCSNSNEFIEYYYRAICYGHSLPLIVFFTGCLPQLKCLYILCVYLRVNFDVYFCGYCLICRVFDWKQNTQVYIVRCSELSSLHNIHIQK